MTTPGQQSLSNIYRSIQFDNPVMAESMAYDISIVALHALGADKSGGQDSATKLRDMSLRLPEVQKRILNQTLTDLGYS